MSNTLKLEPQLIFRNHTGIDSTPYIEDVFFNLDGEYNPLDHTTSEDLSAFLMEQYQKCSEKTGDYCGRNLRLKGFRFENGKLILEVQEMKYRWNIALGKSYDVVDKIRSLGGSDFISKGLSVSICIETADGKYVMGKKGNSTYDFIGGILEFSQLFDKAKYKLLSERSEKNNFKDVNFLRTIILKELKEEVGLKKLNLGEMTLLGCILGGLGRYVLITKITTNLNSEELEKHFSEFNKNNQNPEISEIVILDKEGYIELLKSISKVKEIAASLLFDA